MNLALVFRRPGAAWRTWASALRNLDLATLLLFCALLFPFIHSYHRYPIPSFYQEWMAIFLMLAAATLVAVRYRGERFDLPFAIWVPLALLPSVAIHFVAGNDLIVHGPPLYLVWIGSAVLLMILGRKLAAAPSAFSLADVMAAALLAGALASCVASWHWRFRTGVFDPLPWSPQQGWLGQPNHNALHIWLGVLGISHFALNHKLSWFYFLVGLEILAETAIFTGSRSVYLYAGCGLILGVWAAAKVPARDTRIRLLLIATLPLLILGALQGTRTFLDRDAKSGPGVTPAAIYRYAPEKVSLDARLGLWLGAARITLANPWIGAGPGSYIRESWVISDSLPSSVPNVIPATHAHNMFLQIGAELGAPTALALAGLIGAWFAFAVRRTDWSRNWLHVTISVAILMHNQVEFSLWYLDFLIPAALSMGAAANRNIGCSVRALVILIVAVLGFGLAALLGQDYRRLEEARNESAAGQPDAVRLLAAAKHPIFGAWASTEIAGQPWANSIGQAVLDWHATRAQYVVPLSQAAIFRYINSLERAGKHDSAAMEQRIHRRGDNLMKPSANNQAPATN